MKKKAYITPEVSVEWLEDDIVLAPATMDAPIVPTPDDPDPEESEGHDAE